MGSGLNVLLNNLHNTLLLPQNMPSELRQLTLQSYDFRMKATAVTKKEQLFNRQKHLVAILPTTYYT